MRPDGIAQIRKVCTQYIETLLHHKSKNVYLLDIKDVCNMTCISVCIPFFHLSIRIFYLTVQEKIKMINDKVAAVEPEKGVLLKTDLQGSISKLEEVWEGHFCCRKVVMLRWKLNGDP